MKKRWQLIAGRWAELLILVLVALVISILLFPVYSLLIEKIIQFLDRFHFAFKYIVGIVTVSFMVWMLHRAGGIRFKRDLYIIGIYWPPIWKIAIAATFAYLFLLPVIVKDYEYTKIYYGWIAIIGIMLVVINCLFVWRYNRYSRIRKRQSRIVKEDISESVGITELDSFEKLIEWLQKEEPIDKPMQDRFAMAGVARRIVRNLRESPLKTIGVIGEYGCGKSSILKLVEYYFHYTIEHDDKNLFDSKKIILSKIDGWGLTKETVVDVILKQTVAELSKYVDGLGLMNIPHEYQKALSDAGPWWCKIILTDFPRKDGFKQLERLDEVLVCMGLRMVIILEDLDRNIQKDEKLNEVAGLLDRIKKLDNLSFVMAISTNVDLVGPGISMRLAEHIEVIPALYPKYVRAIVNMFRGYCLKQYQEDVDFLSKEHRENRWGTDKTYPFDPDAWKAAIGGKDKPIFAIPKLLTGPRALKQVLRRTLSAWNRLHGEIDFDDLLMANVLRFAAPEAFDFIHNHIHKLRMAESGKIESASDKLHQNTSENKANKPEQLWNYYLKGKNILWDKKAAYDLIETLFPGITDWNSNKTIVPQHIGREDLTVDYWVRLNTEELKEDEIPDQQVLCAIEKWKKDNKTKTYQGYSLAKAMLNIKHFAEMVNQFWFQFNGQEIKELTIQYFSLLRGEAEKENRSGFSELSNMLSLQSKYSREDLKGEWVKDEIAMMLPINLDLAMDIYTEYYKVFYSQSEKPQEHVDYIISKARECFNDISIFVKALEGAKQYCITQFINIWSKRENNIVDYSKWVWLGDVLIQAFDENPNIVMPQIANIIVEQKQFENGWQFVGLQEDPSSVWSMFKIGKKRMVELVAGVEIELSSFNMEEQRMIQYAQEKAREWLSKHVDY